MNVMTLDQRIGTPVADSDPPDENDDPIDFIDPAFDETTYLRAFPDIAEAVRRGVLASGLAHFRSSGRVEGRLDKPQYRALLERGVRPAPPPVVVDALTLSRAGATLMTGWCDDRSDPLTEISLEMRIGSRHIWTAFPRLPRADVQRTLDMDVQRTPDVDAPRTPDMDPRRPPDATARHRFGFLLVAAPQEVPANLPPGGAQSAWTAASPVFRFASGAEATVRREPVIATDADLRDLALAALAAAAACEADPAVIHGLLDQHVGVQLAAINRLTVALGRTRRLIERFGPARGRYRGSVVTVARGPADQMVPRLALTAAGPGGEAYEFIEVVTDPAQFEPALRAARLAETTLGVAVTVVLQPDGDPAGAGEDAAADIVRSDRLIFLGSALLPRDPDWALRHTAILADAPEEQTRLMGGLVYRVDGSLSHAGYRFERETRWLPREGDLPRRADTVRIHRIGHPAPSAVPALLRPHPVAAVPAAFLSIDRAWFERLGGFTRAYVRAARDDADLCLRSLRQGVPAWVHPLRMWCLERRGQDRPEPSRGGAILNDWLFHRQWDETLPSLLASGGLAAGNMTAGNMAIGGGAP